MNFIRKDHFEAIELWDTCLTNTQEDFLNFLKDENLILSIHAPLLDLGKEILLDENKKSLHETIILADYHGAKNVVLHLGGIDSNEPSEITRGIEIARKVIISNIDLLEKHDIYLCIENVGYLGNDLIANFKQLADFVDSFSTSMVGITFDFSHANIFGGVKKGIDVLGSRIKHIHISDNSGIKEGHHMPLGKGNIDLNLLKQLNTDCIIVIMEIEPDSNWEKNLSDSRKILQVMKII